MLRLNIFGTFRVFDASGKKIPVKSKKSRALLAYLALPTGKPRSREQIMALLWSDRADQQARSSLRQALSGLRKDLGGEWLSALQITDDSLTLDPARVIVEPASPGDVLLDGLHIADPAFEEWLRNERLRYEDASESGPQPTGLALPDKPSIAVLPFTNMSGDSEQDYFSDGITEDIVTALSRLSGLLVVAMNSTLIYKGKALDLEKVRREQGVRHVLTGSVRRAGERIRVTVQLIDTTTSGHQWGEHYDRKLNDIFTVQDEVTKKITTELNVRLARGEEARMWAHGTTNLHAWEKIIRAVPLSDAHVKEQNVEAQRLAGEAVEIDPNYPTAWVALGWTHWEDALWGWGLSQESSMEKAARYAKRALDLDVEQPEALTLLGSVALSNNQAKKAIALCRRAVVLSPNHANNVAVAGMSLIFGGEPLDGLPLMKRAMRLSPIYPQWYLLMVGAVYHLVGEQEKAIGIFRDCMAEEPETSVHRLWLASALIGMGQHEEAKRLAAEVLDIEPDFSVSSWLAGFSADDRLTSLLSRNLGQAGLPG